MQRSIAALFLAGLLTTTGGPNGSAQTVADGTAFRPPQLVDESPPEEGKFKIYGMTLSNCMYGVMRQTDGRLKLKRLDVLKEVLTESGSPQLSDRTVVVRHFTIISNSAEEMRQASVIATTGVFGLVGGLMAEFVPPTPKCPREQTPTGWYDPKEVEPNPVLGKYPSPLIIEISVTVDGKPYDVRAVYGAQPTAKEATVSAVTLASRKLVAAITATP